MIILEGLAHTCTKQCFFNGLNRGFKLDYTRRARWPFRAFCVDGLPQITSYWCNYIKLAEIGNRADPAIGKRDGHTDTQTDRRTDTRTNKHQILGTLYTKGPKGQKVTLSRNFQKKSILLKHRKMQWFLPFRAFCVEGPPNLMFVRPSVCPCV